MSQDSGKNSWYKYLESLRGITTSTSNSLSQRDTIFSKILERNLYYSQFEMCLLSYECPICMKHILEVRMEKCDHEFCVACVPRIHCSEDCRPWLVHSLRADDLKAQQDVINEFKSIGCKIVKVEPKKKRKEPEPEDDEIILL